MAKRIRIVTKAFATEAELDDSETARAIARALPIRARARRWGEEIYFQIDVDRPLSGDARETMEVGELAYWPPGKAFCIFFGPTPASRGSEPRAASD